MFLQRKLIAVLLSNSHKSSGKVAEKYFFEFCRWINYFSTYLRIWDTIYPNSKWFQLKNWNKKCVFDPNFDPKIGSGIFSPNSGIFWRNSGGVSSGPGNSDILKPLTQPAGPASLKSGRVQLGSIWGKSRHPPLFPSCFTYSVRTSSNPILLLMLRGPPCGPKYDPHFKINIWRESC